MKKGLIIGAIVIVLAIGGYLIYRKLQPKPRPTVSIQPSQSLLSGIEGGIKDLSNFLRPPTVPMTTGPNLGDLSGGVLTVPPSVGPMLSDRTGRGHF